jgi:distribution and morphology protein 34
MSSINETNEREEDQYNPYFIEVWDTFHPPGAASRSCVGRSRSIAGSSTQASSQAPSRLGTNCTPRTTPPSSFEIGTSPPKPRSVLAPSRHSAGRPRSLSPFNRDRSLVVGSQSPESNIDDYPDGIVVWNNTVSHLSALSHSNQTLSPYSRSLSHFTTRSVPPRPVQAKTKWNDPMQEETTCTASSVRSLSRMMLSKTWREI